MSSRILIAGGVLTFGSSTLIGFILSQKNPESKKVEMPDANTRVGTYDVIAESYDSKVGWDETVMGMWLLRRWLVKSNAWGDVLEVATGTGRNLSLYQEDSCKSLTLTDASKPMLEQAVASRKQKECAVPIAAAVKTTAENLSSSLGGKKFDTVVDTFGLCSFEDPVKALKEMQKSCKANGKILLLEHGRSATWDILNGILDDKASYHASKWGCVWNRDIMKLVNDSGLTVDSVHHYHFGTTYLIIASPNIVENGKSDTASDESTTKKDTEMTGLASVENCSTNAVVGKVTTSSSVSEENTATNISLCKNLGQRGWFQTNLCVLEKAVATAVAECVILPSFQCNCERCSRLK